MELQILFQMELAELKKIENEEGPPKDTSRTVKPADRCVISYNFQQTHSNNYTHNLLIGMFNEPTKKMPKNVSHTFLDPSKPKLVALAPQPKRILRQQPNTIVKVYDSTPQLKKYVNSNSGRREAAHNRAYYKNSQKSENQESRLKNQRQSYFQKSNQDATIEESPFVNKQLRQRFNEVEERRKSPYKSKKQKKVDLKVRNNSIGQQRSSIGSFNESPSKTYKQRKTQYDSAYKQNENDPTVVRHSPSFQDRKSNKNSSLYSNHGGSSSNILSRNQHNSQQELSFYGRHLQTAQKVVKTVQPVNNKSKGESHLKRVTESQNEINQYSTKRQEHPEEANLINGSQKVKAESIQQESFAKSNGKEESFQIRRSRKQIQDQQMRQIQEQIRREQAGQFKKGYFKIIGNNSKEFLPFNAGLEPSMHVQKRRANPQASSTQNTFYKENKRQPTHTHQRLNPQAKVSSVIHKGAEDMKHTLSVPGFIRKNQQRLLNREGRSTKQSFSRDNRTNKHMSVNQMGQGRNRQGEPKIASSYINGSKKQNRTTLQESQMDKDSKGLGYDDQKGNKNRNGPSRVSDSSFNLKRNNQSQASNNYNQPSLTPPQEDITENNRIKGFKIPEKNTHKAPSLFRRQRAEPNSDSQSRNGTKENSTANPKCRQQAIAPKKDQAQGARTNAAMQAKNAGKSQEKSASHRSSNFRQSKNHNHNVNEDNMRERNSQSRFRDASKQETDRTVKINQVQARPTDRSFRKQTSEEMKKVANKADQRNSQSKALSPTIPRNQKDKNRKFKDWREGSLEKGRKDSRELSNSRVSKGKNGKQSPSRVEKQQTKPRRSKQTQEIDLDAEEQDRFGLLAQKNVTAHKRKSAKRQKQPRTSKNQKEQPKEEQFDQGIQEEAQQSSHTNEKRYSQLFSEEQVSEESEVQRQQHLRNEDIVQNQQQAIQLQDHLQPQKDKGATQNYEEGGEGEQERLVIGHSKVMDSQDRASPKKEGVQQIEHLIEENGSNISSINGNEEQEILEKEETKREKSIASMEKQPFGENAFPTVIIADPINQESNLQELLKATEEVQPNTKQMQPIFNNIELEKEPQIEEAAQSVPKLNAPQPAEVQEGQQVVQGESDQAMAVALPVANMQKSQHAHESAGYHSPRVALDIETDYQEEEMDKIAEIPETNKEHNRTQEFFQCNIKQTSKISDTNQTINFTKYEQIDKDANNYTRAPILSFVYDLPQQLSSFQPSSTRHLLLKKIRTAPEINEPLLDQAVGVLLSIDPWIIQRVFEPFEDRQGKIGVWLYCHGCWKLFTLNKAANYKIILRDAVDRAITHLEQKNYLQTVLKLISGVRVMRLKSSKKKVFNELEYSLKKGHVLKAYTTQDSKWKGKIFEVAKVETTRQNENVLQIRQQNDTYWVKEEKFKEIFEHFLLICIRRSHFWTYRQLEHKSAQKTVLTMASHVPSHGSLTLFYPSAEPSSLLLYKELDSKVLKYMGKIEQKPNHNGNLYFEFRLHGTYALFLQTPASCRLAIQSTSPLEIGEPEFVLRETLRNAECEYVELNQSRARGRDKQGLRQSGTLERLRQTFIKMVVKK